MTGELSAAGELATGALYGRVVESTAGETSAAPIGPLCLNCGTRLAGEFCHACGQNGHVHKTLASIGHDLLHGVFHFEGKIWRTLPMLALHPGALTRRYIAGERARFVSPLAIFLFSVFLMFAVVAQLPGWSLAGGDLFSEGGVSNARLTLRQERAKAVADLADKRNDLVEELRDPDADDRGRADRLRARVRSAEDGVAALDRAQAILPAPKAGSDDARAESGANDNWFEAKWRHARENPQLLIYKLKESAYKYSWALIPLSLPFIWLLFPLRRDVGLYDHAIFATYSLTFMSLLVVVLAVLAALGLGSGIVSTAALVIPPLHIYRQLKGAYGLTRGGALWRTGWMVLFATIALGLFSAVLIYLGLGG